MACGADFIGVGRLPWSSWPVTIRLSCARGSLMDAGMKIDGVPYRTIWQAEDGEGVLVIDQTLLPHAFRPHRLSTWEDAARAISTMVVRGAPLIGATAAWGMALAARADASDAGLAAAASALVASRPTAVNLRWAVEAMQRVLAPLAPGDRRAGAYAEAARICDAEVAACEAIGHYGEAVIREHFDGSRPVNVLTHCNAGWLAAVDWGMSLAPVYKAHDAGIPVHVWVDETRPRNQGAALTAYELKAHGVPHTVIVDNAGGHLMQHGRVDLCIVGSDRVAANGDVCNKIGTYLKALAAHDNRVPFFAALPSSTIDWRLAHGRDIPIEERDETEVTHVSGLGPDGKMTCVRVTPEGVRAANFAFDVTPARLISGVITERGVCEASHAGLSGLFPDLAKAAR
jgi:methylthioribose-1-phosphate isomerase